MTDSTTAAGTRLSTDPWFILGRLEVVHQIARGRLRGGSAPVDVLGYVLDELAKAAEVRPQ